MKPLFFVPVTEKLVIVLRDGRKLIGTLRSYDQYGTLRNNLLSYINSIFGEECQLIPPFSSHHNYSKLGAPGNH